MDTSDELAMMAVDYERHELTTEQGTGPVLMWRCAAPGTNNHSFRVVAAPNALIVYGDSPTDRVLFHPSIRSAQEAVEWLRGAERSPGYMLEKIAGDFDSKATFEPERVTAMILEELRNALAERHDDADRSFMRGRARAWVHTLRYWRWHGEDDGTLQDARDCMPSWFENEEYLGWFRPRGECLRTVAALRCFARLLRVDDA